MTGFDLAWVSVVVEAIGLGLIGGFGFAMLLLATAYRSPTDSARGLAFWWRILYSAVLTGVGACGGTAPVLIVQKTQKNLPDGMFSGLYLLVCLGTAVAVSVAMGKSSRTISN